MGGVVTKLSEAKNVRIESQDSCYVLHADVKLVDGTYKPAEYPLDMVLGNQNGEFAWRSKRFSRSARNISINGTVLTAELCAENGSWQVDIFDLDDQIVVVGGELVVTEIPSVRVLAAAEEVEAAAINSVLCRVARGSNLRCVACGTSVGAGARPPE